MSLLRALLNFFRELLYYKEFITREFRSKGKSTSLKESMKSLRKGFYSSSYNFLNLEEKNYKEYLSDWARFRRINRINDKRKVVLDDKILFHLLEVNNPAVPKLIGIIRNQNLYQYKNNQFVFIDIAGLKEIIKQHKNGIIIKPADKWGGVSITIIKHLINDDFEFVGAWSGFSMLTQVNGNFVISEVVKQTGIMTDIFPGVLNTARILTIFDGPKGHAFIASAAQRFGTGNTKAVDNVDSGGITANIDVETGILSSAIKRDLNNGIVRMDSHPDTNKQIKGLKIENWEEIKKEVIDLSKKYYFVPYIGWDIALMDQGFYLIEGNTDSGILISQLEKGLLANDYTKMFLKNYGVIKN